MYTRKFPMTQLSSDTSNFKFANMYWVKWPCARNTDRSGSGKNQKS